MTFIASCQSMKWPQSQHLPSMINELRTLACSIKTGKIPPFHELQSDGLQSASVNFVTNWSGGHFASKRVIEGPMPEKLPRCRWMVNHSLFLESQGRGENFRVVHLNNETDFLAGWLSGCWQCTVEMWLQGNCHLLMPEFQLDGTKMSSLIALTKWLWGSLGHGSSFHPLLLECDCQKWSSHMMTLLLHFLNFSLHEVWHEFHLDPHSSFVCTFFSMLPLHLNHNWAQCSWTDRWAHAMTNGRELDGKVKWSKKMIGKWNRECDFHSCKLFKNFQNFILFFTSLCAFVCPFDCWC